MLTGIAPILLVKDIPTAVAYWQDKVGFTAQTYGEPPHFAIIQRDGIRLMLARTQGSFTPNWRVQGATSDAYVWVKGIDDLYAELQASGASIDFTLYDTPWGTREFGIQDIDDHDISFGEVIS